MKKIIIILGILMFLVTGCTNVKDLSYDDIVNKISTKAQNSNVYRTGYKYFLPRNMSVSASTLYNEVLDDGKNIYYLYVDIVSYYNKIKKDYQVSNNAIYTRTINDGEKYGYAEVNLIENKKYLVEIMYNYAKIEVIVDNNDVNEAMLLSISILKSIEYNDSIIANMLGDDVLNFLEEEFDIFKTKGNDNNYLKSGDNNEVEEETIPDTDLIN